jgi:branched-chain amino acid transport system permease protein
LTSLPRLFLDDRRAQIVAALVVVYAVGYWLPGSPLPDKMPWGVITQGVIFGTSYGLLAMGLILIYRTTRIVNFAFGAMGAMPGALTVALFTGQGWNYWVAIALGLAVGTGSGAAIEIFVIRRFARSSRLVLTVATIGLAQILGAIGLIFIVQLGADTLIGNYETPLSGSWFVRPYPVRGDHLLMVGIAPVILFGLGWFLLRTDSGTAVRAAAENEDRALLLGVPVRRLQTIVWAVAGGLSTITFITRAPFTGVTPDPTALTGATAILPGLAVAVIARFKSLPIALVGGIGLGIAEWTIRWNVTAESIFDVLFLAVILLSLLLRRDQTSRAETGESSWDSTGIMRPIPKELRGLPEVRRPIFVLALIGLALAIVIPLQSSPSTVVLMSFALIWGMVAVSLVVLTGWGGNISLGQFAIAGMGAMAAGNLVQRWNLDFFVALAASIVAGAVVAVLVGLPALRIRGLYLAVTTLAFGVALDSYFLNPVNFSSFVPDNVVRPVLWKRFDMESEWVTYFFCLGALLLTILVVRAVRRSRAGRVMIGTRDNDRAADAFAVPTTQVKLQTFVLAGCIAGLAGGLYLLVLADGGGVGQGTFRPTMSLEVFSFAVIGGLGSIAGAMSGVFFFRLVDFVLAENFAGDTAAIIRLSLTGSGLLFILYFLPGGLWQFVQRQRDKYLRMVANRRGILVPSLVADSREELDDEPQDETRVIAGALSGSER